MRRLCGQKRIRKHRQAKLPLRVPVMPARLRAYHHRLQSSERCRFASPLHGVRRSHTEANRKRCRGRLDQSRQASCRPPPRGVRGRRGHSIEDGPMTVSHGRLQPQGRGNGLIYEEKFRPWLMWKRCHGAIAEKPQARQVRLADAQELKALVFEPGCTLEGPLLIVLADDSETDPLELSWSPWPRVV